MTDDDSKDAAERNSVLTALEDVLNDLSEEMGDIPTKCKKCPPYQSLSKLAAKIRRAKNFEEERIARFRRGEYDI